MPVIPVLMEADRSIGLIGQRESLSQKNKGVLRFQPPYLNVRTHACTAHTHTHTPEAERDRGEGREKTGEKCFCSKFPFAQPRKLFSAIAFSCRRGRMKVLGAPWCPHPECQNARLLLLSLAIRSCYLGSFVQMLTCQLPFQTSQETALSVQRVP